jgi:hypothetical protein
MDSFVYEAGGHAEHIYGDEGVNGLPPLHGLQQSSPHQCWHHGSAAMLA